MRDYLGARVREPEDKEDHGVKGQKWGVRRSAAQLKSAIKSRAAKGEPVTPTKKAEAVLGEKPSSEGGSKPAEGSSKPASTGETSQARYARLQAQARSGKASEMDEADLKFFNARTEALSKVAKLNETQPNWIKQTAKEVLQQAAKRQLQAVADATADKYIADRVKAGLKNDDKAKLKESLTPLDYVGKRVAKKK